MRENSRHLTDTGTATHRIRFGIYGSARFAERIVIAAGHELEEVEFVPYDVADPFRSLRNGELDIMIVKYAVREPDIVCSRPVAFDDRSVIVGLEHPLAARTTVSLEEVAPFDAFRCPGDFPPHVWDEVVPPKTPAGTPIRRVHPMTTVEAMVDILTRTRAVHVSFRSLHAVLPPNVKTVPVSDLPPAPVTLARLRDTVPPRPVAAFIADAERSAEH